MKIPPPHSYKCSVVAEKGKHFDVLIETGTYNGDMVQAQLDNFKEIHSIELSDELYRRAIMKFDGIGHVHLYHGDSTHLLKTIIPDEPCLFWLDAHWSGGNTAKGPKETPIVEELEVIMTSGLPHGILIDDARCFGSYNDFPTLKELESIIGEFQLENDIIWKTLR